MRVERLILTMGTLAVLGLSSAASVAMDTSEAMALCSRLSKKARLECYDQVAKEAAEGRLTRSAPAAQGFGTMPPGSALVAPPAPQAAAPAQPPSFGSNSLPRGVAERSDGGPDSIQAEVISSTDNGLNQWRFRLADGAIWQMTERVSLFRPPAPHEVVTIRRASMGSFLMDVGKQGSVRVQRIQ